MEVDNGWTVVGTLNELPDQTPEQLMMRPRHVFPLPQSTTHRYDQLIPENVQEMYHQLQQQRQQRDTCVEVADAFKYLNMSRCKQETRYMNDAERRKMKIMERLRKKLGK